MSRRDLGLTRSDWIRVLAIGAGGLRLFGSLNLEHLSPGADVRVDRTVATSGLRTSRSI